MNATVAGVSTAANASQASLPCTVQLLTRMGTTISIHMVKQMDGTKIMGKKVRRSSAKNVMPLSFGSDV